MIRGKISFDRDIFVKNIEAGEKPFPFKKDKNGVWVTKDGQKTVQKRSLIEFLGLDITPDETPKKATG